MSVIVTKAGKEARRLEPSGIPQETFLQEYIVANPEALPLSDLRDDLTLLIVAREFPTTSGPIDAVGLDDQGDLYLIETKLYRNPDKRPRSRVSHTSRLRAAWWMRRSSTRRASRRMRSRTR